jgi:branched-chain amino acid transport system ATP-binding protein
VSVPADSEVTRGVRQQRPASDGSALDGPLIAARKLFAGYGRTTVVRELDLEVHPGEVVALVGPNGAGKTTTLLTMSGQIPALGGEVLFHGVPTTAPLYRCARAGLGLISEQRPVLMTLTVLENLKVSKCDIDMATELFPDLADHFSRRVGLLSGGQQRMVALARILSRSPSVVLADELSLGLAPLIVDRLLAEVRAAADRGVGVLLVEQHVRKAMQIADRLVVMRRGRVRLSGWTAELIDRIDEIQAAYLTPVRLDGAENSAT